MRELDRSRFRWLRAVLVLVTLYVLSAGPVAWWDSRHIIPIDVADLLRVIYFPLLSLADQIDGVDTLLDWYLELFQP